MLSDISMITSLAIQCFQNGKVLEAFSLFKHALQKNQEVLASPISGHHSQKNDSNTQDVHPGDDVCFVETRRETFVFFEISERDCLRQSAARCIFNLGTCYYWSSFFYKDQLAWCQSANDLYQLALVMLSRSEEIRPTVFLATLNGLAEVNHLLQNHEASDKFYNELQRFLMCCMPNGPVFEIFFERTMHLVLKENALAAAA